MGHIWGGAGPRWVRCRWQSPSDARTCSTIDHTAGVACFQLQHTVYKFVTGKLNKLLIVMAVRQETPEDTNRTTCEPFGGENSPLSPPICRKGFYSIGFAVRIGNGEIYATV